MTFASGETRSRLNSMGPARLRKRLGSCAGERRKSIREAEEIRALARGGKRSPRSRASLRKREPGSGSSNVLDRFPAFRNRALPSTAIGSGALNSN